MRFLRVARKLTQGLLLAGLGAGITAGVLLWAPWDSDGESAGSASERFCAEATEWHSAMIPFLKNADEHGVGLSETYELFYELAAKPIPAAHSEFEDEIRTVMLDNVRVHEAWLSELQLLDIFDDASSLNDQAREEQFRAYRESEARRIERNDLNRQSNSLLGDACGLPPLEIYPP